MARELGDQAARRLKEIAAQEEAAAKERLAVRTAAARSFVRAGARLDGARAAWERAQEEVGEAKAKAVRDLLGTGMHAGDVAGLLGVSERELRASGDAAGRRDGKAEKGGAAVPGKDGAGVREGQQAWLAS